MRSSKVLEMLNAGRIEELKAELRDEIYQEILKNKPGAKKRYAAMKKYFSYVPSEREILKKPAMVVFEDKAYTSFTNGYSLALSKEPCGEIELFSDKDRYPNVCSLVNLNGDREIINLGVCLAEAKSLGYTLKKSEVGSGWKYMFKYKDLYFKVGLLDSTFRTIDNGSDVSVFYNGENKPVTIKNELGLCVIMPVRSPEVEDFTVIEIK